MLDTGNLLNFIPKEWAEGEGVIVEGNDKPLALQTLNKVFMYNTVGDKTFTNCWDFVAEGVAPLFMGVNSELVGKNFLYMLTKDTYADYLKDAFDAMPDGAAKDRIAAEVEEMKPEAEALMLDAENAPYALAWIKLFCEQYNEQTDDGPICNTLVDQVRGGPVRPAGVLQATAPFEESAGDLREQRRPWRRIRTAISGIGGYRLHATTCSGAPTTLPRCRGPRCAFIAYMTTHRRTASPRGARTWAVTARTRSACRITLRMVMWTV